MAAFETAFAVVLRHEGGYVANLQDRGGPTNYGISTPVLQAWQQSHGVKTQVTPQDVKQLTVEQAMAIYRVMYWGAIQGDAINDQKVASAFFDMAVLRGVTAAVKSMQTALGVKADGVIGPVTLTTLNHTETLTLLLRFQSDCIRCFIGLVEDRPTQLQFLRGWITRALEMTALFSSQNLS